MTRKLLYIALDFPPLNSSGTYRNAKFVKYLGQFGWQPVVVTLDWHQQRADDPLDDSLLADIPGQVPIVRLPQFHPIVDLYLYATKHRAPNNAPPDPVTLSEVAKDDRPRGRFYKMARDIYHAALTPVGDMFFYWSIRMLPRCLDLARQHQVKIIFVSVSPWTTAMLGVWLKQMLHLPLAVDFRDYWTMWAVKGEPALRDKLNAKVERWILRQADRIICVHQAMADDFVNLEPNCAGKCRVITNGYDVNDFERETDVSRPRSKQTDVGSTPVQLTHTGIAWGDAAMPLLKALAQLKREQRRPHLRVNFIGGLPPSNLQFIEEHRLDDFVQVQSRVPHREAIQRMREADALILLIVGNEGGRKWYPGKIFEYMYARRPVLAIAPKGIATQLIEEAGMGLTVEPHEIERLANVLEEIAGDAALFHRRYYHPQKAVVEQFNRIALTKKLASVLDEVCERRA